MFTTIITDCKKDNEAGRQITRFNSLGLGPTNLIGVESTFGDIPTIEAGANLIDVLDATEGRRGAISVNVAPRGNKKEGGNGNIFCYFFYKKTLIIASTKGYTLSLLPKFGITNRVNKLDTDMVLQFGSKNNLIDLQMKEYISKSQFRSFDFVPKVVQWLLDGIKLPSTNLQPTTYNLPPTIWCIDAFGNAKLTITKDELPCKDSPFKLIKTNLGTFPYFERLKDVPKGVTAVFTGSSGFGNNRFLEIASQAISGSAAKKFNLRIGQEIRIL